jgi:hypothetical protein
MFFYNHKNLAPRFKTDWSVFAKLENEMRAFSVI